MFGIQSELPNFMMTMHPVVSKLEARNYVKRLARFGVKFDQVMEGLMIREEKGVLPPAFVIRRVLDEMTAFAGGQPPRTRSTRFSRKNWPRWQEAERAGPGEAARRGRGQIEPDGLSRLPEVHRLFHRLEKKATTDDGVWKLPNGAAYYAHCLRSNTTTEYTPEQVHEIGLKEVERIEGEMGAILEKLGYKDVKNAAQETGRIREGGALPLPEHDEGRAQAALAEYQRILDEMNAGLDPYFAVRPKAALKVERVPEFREKTSAGAYYQPGDLSGHRPGVFYANLRDMKEIQKFGMKTLAYHEGIPVTTSRSPSPRN